MLNNKIKNNDIIQKISFGLMIILSLIGVIFTIIGIVTSSNKSNNLSILIIYACGLIFPLFIGSFCLYILNHSDYKKPINLVFIAFVILATILYIIGTSLMGTSIVNESIINIETPSFTAGMWMLIIGAFANLFVGFGALIYYLNIVHRNNPNFEKVLKDPEY